MMTTNAISPDVQEAKKCRRDHHNMSSKADSSTTEFQFSSEPTLDQIRQMQSDFARERDFGKFHTPRNLLLAMVGEVGEVAELFQWRGEVQDGLPDWSEKDKKHLSQELSDVLIYLVRLAEKCHIDLPAAVVEKIALNHQKYPASKVHGSCKKYNEYD
ncbi:dCTP pyrophosphatase 1-like [Ptychodera flava]|uniref:dCTP pyrophosphatase 1-like n=1 Tax=Ptychodera flava TaxID=63121 RepID=UPI00396A16DB